MFIVLLKSINNTFNNNVAVSDVNVAAYGPFETKELAADAADSLTLEVRKFDSEDLDWEIEIREICSKMLIEEKDLV